MSDVSWVLFKRCVPGDRRKVTNESNDDPTAGGGSRDLRLNPAQDFLPVAQQLFPGRRPLKPSDPSDTRLVYYGPVYWADNAEPKGPHEVEFAEPTPSRGSDLMIRVVGTIPPFDEAHLPAATLDPFFMLWLDASVRKVFAQYVTVPDLQRPGWPPLLSGPILKAVGEREQHRNIRGWANLNTGQSFIK